MEANPINHTWKLQMTAAEKKLYRKRKHRWHAARSRRLRGKDVPEGTYVRGERQDYGNEEHVPVEGNHWLPTPL